MQAKTREFSLTDRVENSNGNRTHRVEIVSNHRFGAYTDGAEARPDTVYAAVPTFSAGAFHDCPCVIATLRNRTPQLSKLDDVGAAGLRFGY